MRVLSIGTLSTVTTAAYGSGVSTPPIDLSRIDWPNNLGIWLSLEGDLGRTGASVSVIARSSYSKAGVTWPIYSAKTGVTEPYLIKSGTSKTGFEGNGAYLVSLPAIMPFLKLEAIASGGAGTTNNMKVMYAVCHF